MPAPVIGNHRQRGKSNAGFSLIELLIVARFARLGLVY